MSDAINQAGGQQQETSRTVETAQVMRVPPGGGELAVVTPQALEQYFAVERRRNFRALCWISSAFLLVILAVCSLFLSLGSLVMRNSRSAMAYASQTAEKADLALRGYDHRIQETVTELETVDKKANEISQSVATDRQKYSKERDTLRQDLVRFSEWYGVKQSRVNNAVTAIGTIEQKLAELERKDNARQARFEDLERWFREARGPSRESAPVVLPQPAAPQAVAAVSTAPVVAVAQNQAPAQNPVPAPPAAAAAALPTATNAGETAVQTITYEDGGKYAGDVKNGLKHGRGEQTFPNGDRYVGSFLNDIRQGSGIYYYTSGARYEGEFAGGKREGRGRYFYPNGDVYDGFFSGGMMNGAGVYTYANGTQIDGFWRDDTFSGN